MILETAALGRTMRVEVQEKNGRYSVSIDGRILEIDLVDGGGPFLSLLIGGRSYEAGLVRRPSGFTVVLPEDVVDVAVREGTRGEASTARPAVAGSLQVTAPMPGKVVRVLCAEGDDVPKDKGLVVMEAMKMENELKAPRAGRIRRLLAREGQAVERGAVLVVFE